MIIVTDELGYTGIGEAAPLPGMSIDVLDDAVSAAADLAARVPLLIESPAHATGVADRVTAAPAARFAIETALLTALAQRAHTSVAALWNAIPQGELRSAIVVDDEVQARAAVAAGARCLKIKVGADDLDRVKRISAAAPAARLRVDANRSWPRDGVAELMAQLADLPIDYVEEPCEGAHELLGHPGVCRIALDESLVHLGRADLARALESPQLAALVLKPTLLGGFARCFELASAAHRHGVAPVVSHTLEGPIGYAACIELGRAIGADVPVGLAPHGALDQFAAAL
ncbi:MAG: o-succinylbenzoate synthase [Myxococcales bacterium]|nr:o-succinylbenzoate synthase [Myxococcales bacterium]